MSDKNIDPLSIQEQLDNFSAADIIPDIQVVSREKRIQQTPSSNGEWILFGDVSGPRGMCKFRPYDKDRKDLLAGFGTDHVKYSMNGEPDFSDFAEMQVKISNMEGGLAQSRAHNFSNANKKLLGTKWAEEKGLKTQADIQEYMRQNRLTWHEKSDGVTMQLVPSAINSGFGHVGGVSTMANLDADDPRIGHSIGVLGVKAKKAGVKAGESIQNIETEVNNFIGDSTRKFISEDFSRINRAGIDAAAAAAIFAGTLSVVQNTMAVAKGDKTTEEARREIAADTAAAAATAYVTGALAETFFANLEKGEAALLAAGSVQISKHIINYAEGKIDERQLATAVAESSANLAAGYIGKNVGAFVGSGLGFAIGSALLPAAGGEIGAELGELIGKVVGELITATVCTEVMSTIKFAKDFKKKNDKIISLYKKAEREIRESQQRLEAIIQKENNELISAVREGFDQIYKGIQDNSYEKVKKGIAAIGYKFGLSEDDFERDMVSKNDIFKRSGEILVIE